MLQKIILGAFKAENGSLSGTCHKPPDSSRVDVVVEAFGRTAFANPLNPDAFPGIRKMEAEVVRMTCTLFNGDPNSSCGTVIIIFQ
jgi:sphinganine-1-phosphate aldolase